MAGKDIKMSENIKLGLLMRLHCGGVVGGVVVVVVVVHIMLCPGTISL